MFGNNFQWFRATTNPIALRDTSALLFETLAPPCRTAKSVMPAFEGVCPHAGMSMMQRPRHLTKCMVSEAAAAQNTKVPCQGTNPDKDGSFLNYRNFKTRERWPKTEPPPQKAPSN
jgi:hypothetical protein